MIKTIIAVFLGIALKMYGEIDVAKARVKGTELNFSWKVFISKNSINFAYSILCAGILMFILPDFWDSYLSAQLGLDFKWNKVMSFVAGYAGLDIINKGKHLIKSKLE